MLPPPAILPQDFVKIAIRISSRSFPTWCKNLYRRWGGGEGEGSIKHLVHSQGNTPLACSSSSNYQYASKQTGTRYVRTMAFGDQSIVASLTPLRQHQRWNQLQYVRIRVKFDVLSFVSSSFERHSNGRNISMNTALQVKFNVSVQCFIVIQCTKVRCMQQTYISWSSTYVRFIQGKFNIYSSLWFNVQVQCM